VRCSFLDSRDTMELAAREAVAEVAFPPGRRGLKRLHAARCYACIASMQSLHSPLLHRCSIAPASFLHPCSTRAAPVLHRSCIDACACLHPPASMQHPCSTRAASFLHRCLRMLASPCIDAAPVQHPCCIAPASMLAYACILLHRSCTRAASMLTHACIRLHRCLHMLAYACIRLHRCLHMLAYACICLHSPASMLAPALHRFCIRLHRTEPTKGEARRLVRFSDQRIESTCETCDDTRGARTRAHPRPSSVLLRSFPSLRRLPCRLPVPPPSSFVLSSPSRPSSILSRSSIACLVACLVLRHPSHPFPSLSRCRPGRVRCSFLDSRGTMELAAREAVAEVAFPPEGVD
jgi:hypothetical protein